jgi:putative membrane protein
MHNGSTRLQLTTYLLVAVFLLSVGMRGLSDTTMAMIISSLVMFCACLVSAIHLMGLRATLWFAAIAVSMGWFAEQMGSSYGWFFGSYDYTDVLGPRVGDVPFIIPLMWFALTYMGYVIANLIVWRAPVDGSRHLGEAACMSLLAAMIVTAYDLGADPYMVYVLKAWIMAKKDGAWFGETVQGFVGWTFVGFCIVFAFRLVVRRFPVRPATGVDRRHALLPLLIYAGLMVFQIVAGFPVETRSIAVFAMGIPLLCALAGWRHWRTHDATSQGETADGPAYSAKADT